jgi:hypothetical protein
MTKPVLSSGSSAADLDAGLVMDRGTSPDSASS